METVIDHLDDVMNEVWYHLSNGARDRRSAFHTLVLATGENRVRQRIMVLRAADRQTAILRFHTDRRSPKVAAIGDGAPVSVLGYDPQARVQISMHGHARLSLDPTPFWQATQLTSRRCYLVEPGPGSIVSEPGSGVPEAFKGRVPTEAESAPGEANFAALLVTVDHIDWLHLDASGGRRAVFESREGAWAGSWVIP